MIKTKEKSELVYRFIVDYKQAHGGNSPSIREICRACDLSSTSLAYYYLGKLEDQKRLYIDLECKKVVICGAIWTATGG